MRERESKGVAVENRALRIGSRGSRVGSWEESRVRRNREWSGVEGCVSRELSQSRAVESRTHTDTHTAVVGAAGHARGVSQSLVFLVSGACWISTQRQGHRTAGPVEFISCYGFPAGRPVSLCAAGLRPMRWNGDAASYAADAVAHGGSNSTKSRGSSSTETH